MESGETSDEVLDQLDAALQRESDLKHQTQSLHQETVGLRAALELAERRLHALEL